MDPKVSIIIPVYNTEKYLKQCLETVCSQTLKEIQIICVDDGSTDSSFEIMNEFKSKDSRVEVYKNIKETKGAGAARNHGMSYAKGEYLLFLDSDDYFEPDLVEKTYNKAKESDLDVVLFDANFYDDHLVLLKSYTTLFLNEVPNKDIFNINDCSESFFQISLGMAWSKIWKRSFIMDNNLSFQENTLADDTCFTYSAMSVADKISVLPERLVNYRFVREGNQTSNKDSDVCSSIACANELKKFLTEHDLYEELKYSFIRTAMERCISHLRTFKTYEAFEKLFASIKDFLEKEILSDVNWKACFDTESQYYANNKAKQRLLANITNIINMNPNEFLYEQYKKKVSYGIVFPDDSVEKTDRIILYGAGDVGRGYFTLNIKYKFCNIIGWADRNYANIGFPVISPTMIKNLQYDKIIIAIEKEELVSKIKCDLINLGVNCEKIIWKPPYHLTE